MVRFVMHWTPGMLDATPAAGHVLQQQQGGAAEVSKAWHHAAPGSTRHHHAGPRCTMQQRARPVRLPPAGVGVTKLGVLNMGEANAEKEGMWLGPAAELGSC